MRNLTSRLAAPIRQRVDSGHSRPLLAALPTLGGALLVLVVGFAASIGWQPIVAVALVLTLVGLLNAAWAAVALGRRRRAADEWLLWGATARPSTALGWRAAELESPQLRSTLARGLWRIQREVRGGTRPGPVPLNTRALRLHLRLVCSLQERLDDRTRSVSARGMVLVNRLLTEPGSPLYTCEAQDEVLADALSDALLALDPVPHPRSPDPRPLMSGPAVAEPPFASTLRVWCGVGPWSVH
jgi:hypothetical protein